MPGWNDSSETIVGSDGQAYFAPVGTDLPQPGDDPRVTLDTDFVGGGFVSEDGPTQNVGQEVTGFPAWQALQDIRRERTGQPISVALTLLQWNENNVVLAFGGGTVTDEGGGLYSYVYPNPGDDLDERSLVLDVTDGDTEYRFVYARGNVSENVESTFNRNSMGMLPITFSILQPEDGSDSAWFLTNSPAYAAGS